MITVTLTLNINELEARRLWEKSEDKAENDTPPAVGQDLADFVAEHAMKTIESNWKYDYAITPEIKAGASTSTITMIEELQGICPHFADNDKLPVVLRARYLALADDLVGGEYHELQTIALAYAHLRKPVHKVWAVGTNTLCNGWHLGEETHDGETYVPVHLTQREAEADLADCIRERLNNFIDGNDYESIGDALDSGFDVIPATINDQGQVVVNDRIIGPASKAVRAHFGMAAA